jgi:hypothetical protein
MTLFATPPTSFGQIPHPYLEKMLIEARERVQVSRAELDEARSRRSRIKKALIREFGGEVYYNGSIAHGDALTPLTDVDLGIIVPNSDGAYGPNSRGPADLQRRAADAIRAELKDDFPNLRVTWEGRRRAVFVQFGDPVTTGQKDFTADVITAIDNQSGAGLYIPDNDNWSRSAPQMHTELIADRNRVTNAAFARTMRLLKHWARKNGQPLCSWNIKALGLGCILTEMTMFDGLRLWFDYAIADLREGPTKDPAGVATEPIAFPGDWKIADVLVEIRGAARGLQRAARFEEEGYPALALDELAKVFNDSAMMPGPDKAELDAEIKRRGNGGTGALPATIPSSTPPAPRRSWGTA